MSVIHHDTVYIVYVNSLLGLSVKPNVEIEIDLHWKKKVLDICVYFDKISIVSAQTREMF